MRFEITEVVTDFPDFVVAAVTATHLRVSPLRSEQLASYIADVEAEARRMWEGIELSAIPGIAAWRRAYRAFGIKKTSYRSSVERLMKNALAGNALPEINGFVDAYNAVSLAHVLPAGADDLDQVQGDLVFRYARPGDDFLDMGATDESGAPLADPPKPGEVVYADGKKVLCRRWNWRQDARSAIRFGTERALVTLQSNGIGNAAAAAHELIGRLADECGGQYAVTILDVDHPRMELSIPS